VIAIIPAAGKGTRMAAVTGGNPKELLRLGRKRLLERIVDEALKAGADEIVVVTSPEKPQVEEFVRGMAAPVRVAYQTEQRGVGDAVAIAGVDGDALVLLGDCAFHGGSPLERMSTLVFRGIDGCIAVEPVADDQLSLYGIAEIDGMGGIRRLLEKPKPEETESRYAIAARYAFSGRLMAYLNDYAAHPSRLAQNSEVNLTQGLVAAIAEGFDIKAVALQPGQRRVDCGSPEEYSEARRLDWDEPGID